MTRLIKWKVLRRLAVAVGAGSLLLLSLAYWWQSNLVHEAAGVAMFGFVGWHIVSNRHWLLNLLRGRYDGRRRLIAALHIVLMANMIILIGTSVAISQSLFSALPIPKNVTVRDLHWVAAYWLVMTVGVHLGLHWARVMAMTRSTLRISQPSPMRTWLLRLAAMALVLFGFWSTGVMNLVTKLTWNYSLDFWDFNRSVAPFFAHWAGILALPAVATYYAMRLFFRFPDDMRR